jgi:hypothetical protein
VAAVIGLVAVSRGVWRGLVRELATDFGPLLEGTRCSRIPMPLDEFLHWVTDRAGRDRP